MHESQHTWLILTPEYPPKTGGVSDYSSVLAAALANTGDRVHLIAPGPLRASPGIVLHPLGDEPWTEVRGVVARLGKEVPSDAVLFVQYVPHGFGRYGLNLPFCVWVGSLPLRTFVMVHEPGWGFRRGQPLRHDLLALGQRLMLSALCRPAERVLCSAGAWQPMIRRWSRRRAEWCPVFGVGGALPSAEARRDLRKRHGLGSDGALVVHFGTHRPEVQDELLATLGRCLRTRADLTCVFVGRGTERYHGEFESQFGSEAARRVLALGAMDEQAFATWLGAADVVYLPFVEGVTSRRTTVMNALRVGACVLTTRGPLSEPIWGERAPVALYEPGGERGAERLLALLGDAAEREAIARRGAATYDELFDVRHTVKRLRRSDSTART